MVIHYENGQKTDIQFNSSKQNLEPIIQQSITSTGPHDFDNIVPAGKRWVLQAAVLSRTNSGLMELVIRDPTFKNVLISSLTGTEFPYTPTSRISLPAGWNIRASFGAGVVGVIKAILLVEQENEY